MTKKYCTTPAALALSVALLSPAFGNHRTGSLPLPELIVAGDLNEDGNMDLVVNVTGFDHIAFLLGDGLGGFTLSGRVPTDTLPRGLAIADLNRDGHLDIVGANNWGYNVEIHLGDGKGGFGYRDNSAKAEGGPNRVVLADFNNDLAQDMAVVGPDEGVALIYLGKNNGGFEVPPSEIRENIPNCQGLAVADFNNDGNVDLAFTSYTGKGPGQSHVEIFLGDGTGAFSTHSELPINDQAGALGIGDLNNDGKIDLIVAGAGPGNPSGNFLQMFLGDGTGNFTLKQSLTLDNPGTFKGEIAVADFNEDGTPDVAFPVSSAPNDDRMRSTSVHLLFGDGTGNLVQASDLTVDTAPHTVIAVDLNKDSHLDLAVTNRTGGTVSILLGDGAGAFTLVTTISVICKGGVCN